MKLTKKSIAVLFVLFAGLVNKTFAQYSDVMAKTSYIFTNDSLAGFDEQAATAFAAESRFFGQEFKFFMYNEKRKFINEKYNIKTPLKQYANSEMVSPVRYSRTRTVVANSPAYLLPSSGACTNDDFEDAQSNPGAQIGGAVNGWSLAGGTGATYCNPSALNATNLYTVYNAPVVDPYMVFPNNTVASYFDATSNVQPAGNCFIRLNNDLAGAKVVRATKTYTVNANNAVFRYAYRAVISNPGHSCCQQPGFVIKVTVTNTITGASTLLACPQVSVAAGNACGAPAPGFSVGVNLNGSPSAYNPVWVPASMDLSANIGFQVTLDVYAIDCQASGHAGYVYFDALCSPMTILGNGNGFPAGTPQIILPTCGAAGATITAPPGLGPYSWSSGQIGIPPPLTVPNNTNTVLVTNQSGTVQLTMAPPGGCAPIIKVITVSITPAPILLASAQQPGCTSTLSAATITVAGSASVNPVITWSPTPGSIAGNSLSASGLPIGVTTITVLDPLGCKIIATVTILPAPPPVTFTINNLTGSPSITCTNPVINLQAVSNYTYGPISYTWTSPSFTANTSTVNISAANTLTLIGTDQSTGCLFTETVAIGIFTTAPTNSVNPTSQAITCASNSAVTFTGTVSSPTINVQHDWYSPFNPLPGGVPIATTNNTISILTGAIPPGTYTLITTNLFNGCTTAKTITVTSLSAFPTFSVSSPTGYSVGCAPLNQTTINIVNPQSTQTPSPATCSFTFLPPGFAGVLSSSVVLSGNTSTVTQLPGTWTVIVQDNSNFCKTQLSVPIIQNTVAPNVSATILQQTLTCYQPTLLATGTSSTPNTIITWGIPVPPNQLSTSTVEVGPANGPNTSTTSLTYANYTVIATNTINACTTTSVMVISQNFKPPVSSPTISIGTPTAIYCSVSTNPVILTTGASTTTSGMGPLAFAVPALWEGPSPQFTTSGASSYSCYVPGVYTLTIKDNANGCLKTGTINVLDRTQPPVVTTPLDSATLDCGNNRANLAILLTGTNTGGMRYLINEYPSGAAFSPSSAIVVNLNPILSGTSASLITVSDLGRYEYVVTNTLTGCSAIGSFIVAGGDLVADFNPSAVSGYAPLSVAFDNLSASTLGSASITSVWGFGNGTSQTTTANISTSATYNSPGTYTVTLLASKGSCIDTISKVIKVEIPSKMEVPNVFTPNGDGSNDVFFLKVANLTEITAVIFDRWGNKVYDVTSATGNIAWDGKNLTGKECPDGIYFYVIKAKGKDDKAYETKGNITLAK